jgi:2-keto-4-pentenoate hydratase/2-oxohepta-3-ene-1,7-dioic acid hydratase in catechol pathway
VLCSGQNHAVRAAESGVQTPQQPVLFLEHPNTIVGAYDDILLPPGSDRTDWEVDPALIIGRRAHYLVSHLSQYLVLEPGDIINTGIPEGLAFSGGYPYLAAGDVVDRDLPLWPPVRRGPGRVM